MADDVDLTGDLVRVSELQLRGGILARLAYSDRTIITTSIVGTLAIAGIFAWTIEWWQVALFVTGRLIVSSGSRALAHRIETLGPEAAVEQGFVAIMNLWMAAVAASWVSVVFFIPSPVLEHTASVLGLLAIIAVESVVVLIASVSRRSTLVVLSTFWACLSLRVVLDTGDSRLGFLACNLLYHLLLGMHAFNQQRQTERQVRNEIVNRVLLERVTQLHLRVRQHRDELERVNLQLQGALDRTNVLARQDHLTGVLNRRSFLEEIREQRISMQRHHRPAAIVLLDLDHFKDINDGHGHAMGDQVLVQCTQVMRNELRTGDLLARWGGEEFIVMLPDTTLADARAFAERLRQVLADTTVDGHPDIQVTASFGVSQLNASAGFTDAMSAADEAMYTAKAHGRNQVRLAVPASE